MTISLGLACLVPSASQAKFSRHSGYECVPINGSSTDSACPIYDNSDYAKGEIDRVSLFFWDNSNTTAATGRVCVERWDSFGGVCELSSSTGAGFVGDTQIILQGNSIDLITAATNSSDFAYVYVYAPGSSYLMGYWTAD
ncbi:MAG: hypothetical protein AAGF11_26695 [Myxococcota bacterium]